MALTSGTRVGPYQIGQLLGAGGMGEVYRAWDKRLERTVAIKVLPESLAKEPDRLQRFQQEARILGTLNHPNLLAIFDVGNDQGLVYLVSEYLEGTTLRERLSAGALPFRDVVEFSTSIANGLAAAHNKAIIHRDLKPENIFITRNDQVKILDFGLAKFTVVGSEVQTISGAVMGTVGYMSPEQVLGSLTDVRSDIFSFGSVLYEMLTGQRTFKKETPAETMTCH